MEIVVESVCAPTEQKELCVGKCDRTRLLQDLTCAILKRIHPAHNRATVEMVCKVVFCQGASKIPANNGQSVLQIPPDVLLSDIGERIGNSSRFVVSHVCGQECVFWPLCRVHTK
jgi:hypothetical protein